MEKGMKLLTKLDLSLFDVGTAGEAGAVADGNEAAQGMEKQREQGVKEPGKRPKRREKNPLAGVKYGRQPEAEQKPEESPAEPLDESSSPPPELRRDEFERLIKRDYKDLFDERVHQIINKRFRKTKTMEEDIGKLNPVVERLASKYGVDARDTEALWRAIEGDSGYDEEEAARKGVSVEQLKEMKRLEQENERFHAERNEALRQEDAVRKTEMWTMQSEVVKQIYPDFDLRKEVSGEHGKRFLALLDKGLDVKTAFEVVHKDELIHNAMRQTAQTVQEQVVNDIRARGARPAENGIAGSAAAAIVKSDPATLTRKDREEISRRVLRGERIEF